MLVQEPEQDPQTIMSTRGRDPALHLAEALEVVREAAGAEAMSRAVAIDAYGNEGPVFERVLAVIENEPPGVNFSRLAPVGEGPIPTGSSFAFEIVGVDEGGLSELKVSTGGAVVSALHRSMGQTYR